MTRLYLTRSGGRSGRPVGVLHENFTIFGGNKSHHFLFLRKNLLYKLCRAWDLWCRIFGWYAVHHVCLVVKFCVKAAHNIVYNICLPVPASSRVNSLALECDPSFLNRREMIPRLDGISKISGLVNNILGLGDRLGVWIGTVFHVPVLKKVLNIFENVVEWSHGVIVNKCYFFVKIVQMNWWDFLLRWYELHYARWWSSVSVYIVV